MIHRIQSHRDQADKVARIYKDKKFVHEGTTYILDILSSKAADRMNNVRPKDHIHDLSGTTPAGGTMVVTSDKCVTAGEHAQIVSHPLTIAECEPPADDDVVPAKPKPVKPKAPAKPKVVVAKKPPAKTKKK